MDPFLLKMQQINAITIILTKHFVKETSIFDDFEAELLTFICIGEVFFEQESLNYHQVLSVFHRAVWLFFFSGCRKIL